MLNSKLQTILSQRQSNFLNRSHFIREGITDAHLIHQGKKYLSFSSNNYLGLTHHPKVINAFQKSAQTYGVGSGSAYLITGYTPSHYQLEEKLAEFLGYPRVLLFSSGYMANLGMISSLFSPQDEIFADKFNHASLLDGCLASKAQLKRYPHCSVEILEKLCTKARSNNKVIVTEGIFGMDGTISPLNQISAIAEKYQAFTIVDDAHGIGVLGKTGRGTLEHHHHSCNDINILTGTLGKAFGTYGAFVASTDLIINGLIQLCRTYLYTTAIPPAVAAASLASLKIIEEESWRREKIFALIQRFKHCARQLEINCLNSDTPIQPILVGDNQNTLKISQKLFEMGIYVKAILPPTVPKNTPRLRITITADHTEEQIDYLLETLANEIKKN